MNNVIKVENLGKKYLISHQQPERYLALRDVITNGTKKIAKKIMSPKNKEGSKFVRREEFWALRNVFFDVNEGDRIGIIGKNGAGKTTILKLLSRITEPSEGRILIKGRVASLLEVGTGFHPELTGRENIFLNGAVLGMGRSEIRRKFDEIVDFAGVEKFLDTPVKRYSSGMYVRLAFSVAAHLEPEILIVDEVLAVGDAQFQKKSLGKMEDVSREGRTVLFVSHNMGAVEQLCSRGILLDNGKIITDGDISDTIKNYLKNVMTDYTGRELERRVDRHGSGRVRAMKFKVFDLKSHEIKKLKSGKDYCFEIQYFNDAGKVFEDVAVSLDVFDDRSNRVLLFRTNFEGENINIGEGYGKIICKIKNLPLAKGVYSFSIFMSKDKEVFDYIKEAAFINVNGGDFFGTGSDGTPSHCKILHRAEWLTE
jgi:lipopolysaccharide transport system ATP-binding protein